MNSLYLRIYATVVAVLLLFAFASGFLVEQHIDRERQRNESAAAERLEAWGDLFQRSLPRRRPASRNPGGGAARVVAAAALPARARRRQRPSASALRSRSRGGWKKGDQAVSGQARRRPHAVDALRPAGGCARGARRRGGADGRPQSAPPPWPRAAGQLAARHRPGDRPGGALHRRRRRRLSGGAAADPPARGAEAAASSSSAPASSATGSRSTAATRSRRSPRASTSRRSGSRPWCSRTARCSPTPATSCARRWRG